MLQAELAALRDRKAAMLSLNVQTHRLITDVGNSSSLIFTALKDGVADLYRVWDETFQKWVSDNSYLFERELRTNVSRKTIERAPKIRETIAKKLGIIGK